MVMATRERPETVPVSAVFFRGNPESPGEKVSPAELMVLSRNRRDVVVPENDEARVTTGRRLAYARQLTDGSHPLAARVFVNRVWTHHMGRGIVATPSDFGISGERPSHPELLDWLADDFVRHGWDQKRLHRMILLSKTYQQLSKRTPQLDTVDPENALLGRMNLRRLEAEAIRDAILAVIGNLDRQLSGPSVPVTENPEGKVVIGRRQVRDGLKAGVDGANADAWRRSAYIEVQRRLPLNMLATFDQPEMTPNCELRRPSTVATQPPWFLNDAMIVECADALARLMWTPDSRFSLREKSVVRGANDDNLEAQIQEVFVRMFAAPPNDRETRACLEFLRINSETSSTNQRTAMRSRKAKQRSKQWPLSAKLFASNRFLYVD